MRRMKQWIHIGLGVAGIVIAAGLAFAPQLLPAPVAESLRTLALLLSSSAVTVAVVGLGLVYSMLKFRSVTSNGTVDAFSTATPELPETDNPVIGENFDQLLAQATPAQNNEVNTEVAKTIRDQLRDVGIRTYHHQYNCSREAATEAVQTGDWTEYRIPAAFLGAEPAPTFTLWERLNAWFLPQTTFIKRVRKTAVAIEELTQEDKSAFATTHSAETPAGLVGMIRARRPQNGVSDD